MDNKSILPTACKQTKAKQSCNLKICAVVGVFVCLMAMAVIAAAVTVVIHFAKETDSAPHELDLESKERAHSMVSELL